VSDLTYLVSYLEGNAPFLEADAALAEAKRFLEGRALRAGLATALGTFASADSTLGPGCGFRPHNLRIGKLDHSEREAFTRLDTAAEALNQDLAGLLGQLGARISPESTHAAIFGLASRIAPGETRGKFASALDRVKARRMSDLACAVEGVRKARFEAARAQGFVSPVQLTIAGGTLELEELEDFIVSVCKAAEATACELTSAIDAPPRTPFNLALAWHLQTSRPDASTLRVPVTECTNLACEIAESAFGVTFEREGSNRYEWLVRDGRRRLGRIILDRSGSAAGETASEGSSPNERASGPTGRALCRVVAGSPDVMHLEAVRALFHEFGHALVHIMTVSTEMGSAAPNTMAIERFELASTWFEHFIYHPTLDDRLELGRADRAKLAAARRIKTLEAMASSIHSAASAALDLALHNDPFPSVETALRDIAASGPAFSRVPSSDLLTYFVHPFSRAYAGGAFVYPLAHSFAAERFASLLEGDFRGDEAVSFDLEAAIKPTVSLSTPDAAATPRLFARLLSNHACRVQGRE
jgi:oligopeptidase A